MHQRVFKRLASEAIFTKIYHTNSWGGVESISGPGSEGPQIQEVSRQLPILLRRLGIKSMLDLPCGDFNWMRHVELGQVLYVGGDIVECLIAENIKKYGSSSRSFQHINLLTDRIPRTDLIFCRDCFVHLSNKDIVIALENICRSKSHYFMSTSFIHRSRNFDIVTGQWRPLNLVASPFLLPPPLHTLLEHCSEGSGRYADKALLLWRIEDIAPVFLPRK